MGLFLHLAVTSKEIFLNINIFLPIWFYIMMKQVASYLKEQTTLNPELKYYLGSYYL